jgi:hypothetical protein
MEKLWWQLVCLQTATTLQKWETTQKAPAALIKNVKNGSFFYFRLHFT